VSGPHTPTSPWKGEVGREAAGRGSPSRYSRTPEMTDRARQLRHNLTDVERKLWYRLRRDQLNGLNFRRQHPVGPYVLDFYCPALRLAIELDGGQHNIDRQRRKDDRRTRWLGANGIKLVRFWNNDVTGNLQGVLEEIARVASELTPSPTLPLSGGGGGETVPVARNGNAES
jgi:very-short-patch-repair endonuclease